MHLVIQGADIETRDLKELAKLSGAPAIDRLSATAFRLRGAQPADGIAALCSNAKLDFGFVPEGRKLTDFRLLVMDMDSTLITMETIDELADMVNIKAEVARITERAMRGEIEYDQSLRERNPQWGIRRIEDVKREAAACRLALRERHAMPANNLLLVFQRK